MSCTHPWTVLAHVLFEATPACSAALDTTDFAFQLTPLSYLGYFTLTCLLELPFVYVALRGRSIAKILFATVALNLATHPLICLYLVNHAQGKTFGEFTLAAEGFAFAFEMLLISVATRSVKTPGWIFLANAFSWAVGSFL